MTTVRFEIHGPSAECVVGTLPNAVATYWSKLGTSAFQEYMDCDADGRNDEFVVPADAQIETEWSEVDSEAHINGPLIDAKTVLVVWDVDQDNEVLRVPITGARISVEEVLGSYVDFEDEVPPIFKAVAYGKGDFVTDPVKIESSLLRAENLTISIFTFDDDTMVVSGVGVGDDLQDLEEESGRTISMTCWID